jgi:hypothetical protein
MQFPPIDKVLLDTLRTQFPDQVPEITDSDREVGAKIGEQRVIRFLARVFEEQTENILTQKVT